MNKFTIQQLQQMRESEDRVEFKAGEGGNVSYDGRGKTNPKDRRHCTATLKKLLSQGLLVETGNGIKLTPLYEEMKLRAGVIDRIEEQNVPVNDTVNVPVNDTIKLSRLTERQCKIYHIIKDGTINDTVNDTANYTVNTRTLAEVLGTSVITIKRDIATLQSTGLIKRVGSDKTGHWEVIN